VQIHTHTKHAHKKPLKMSKDQLPGKRSNKKRQKRQKNN
jgi:hypothetical protein